MNDSVKSPKHYQVLHHETISIIASAMDQKEWRGYCLGNVIKYRMRAGKKDKVQQDIDKADYYEVLYDQLKSLCRTSPAPFGLQNVD